MPRYTLTSTAYLTMDYRARGCSIIHDLTISRTESGLRRTYAEMMRGHTPSKGFLPLKRQDCIFLLYNALNLKDAFKLHKGSHVVSTWKIVSLIFQCSSIAVNLLYAATNPKIEHKAFLQ